MPNWTLGNLLSYATKRIGNRADLSESDCSFWANQALEDIIRDVPELLSEKTAWFSVSSGDSILSLPADFYEPIDFSNQTTTQLSSATLHQCSPEWADAQGYYPVGPPQAFFIYNDQIQLWPSADSSANTTDASSGRSYQLRYRANAGSMVSLTDVPSIATMHRIGILYKLEEYLNTQIGNLDEASLCAVRYTGFVSTLKDAMARRQANRGEMRVSLTQRPVRGANSSDYEDWDIWRRF